VIKKTLLILTTIITILGIAIFALTQHFAKKYIQESLSTQIGCKIALKQISIDPINTSFSLDDLSIHYEQTKLFSTSNITAQLSIKSLLQGVIGIKELTLSDPYINIVIQKDKTVLTPPLATNQQSQKSQEALNAYLELLQIKNATIDIEDNSLPTPLKETLSNINFSISDITNIQNKKGRFGLSAQIEQSQLDIKGSHELSNIQSSGTIALQDFPIKKLMPYLEPYLQGTITQGELEASLQYSIKIEDQKPILSLDAIKANIHKINIYQEQKLIALEQLFIKGAVIDGNKNALLIEQIDIKKPYIDAILQPDGSLNLAQLIKQPKQASQQDAPLSYHIQQINIDEGRVLFTDKFNCDHFQMDLHPISIQISNLNSEQIHPPQIKLTYENGQKVTFDGTFDPMTSSLEGDLIVAQFDLALFAPYLQKYLKADLAKLSLDLQSKISANKTSHTINASIDLSDLQLKNPSDKKLIASFKRLTLSKIYLDTQSLTIKNISLQKPYAHVQINKDKSTSLQNILLPQQPSKTSSHQKPLHTGVIEKLEIKEGQISFHDRSLQKEYHLDIGKLGGSITHIDLLTPSLSTIDILGRVGKFAQVKVKGKANLLDPIQKSDIVIKLHNIDLAPLSPYTYNTIGYKINKGKLDSTNHIKIDKHKLESQNEILIEDITLGEKSKDANSSIPLELGIALMKDIQGDIKLSLPVKGDLDDPSFHFGNVVAGLFFNTIIKTVASPFSLLGAIFDISDEELKHITYEPAATLPTLKEQEKLVKLSKSLTKKADIAIRIQSCYDPIIDAQMLAILEVQKKSKETNITKIQEKAKNIAITDEHLIELSKQRAQALKKFFVEQKIDLSIFDIQSGKAARSKGKNVVCDVSVEVLKK
jgi:hypothetical protein